MWRKMRSDKCLAYRHSHEEVISLDFRVTLWSRKANFGVCLRCVWLSRKINTSRGSRGLEKIIELWNKDGFCYLPIHLIPTTYSGWKLSDLNLCMYGRTRICSPKETLFNIMAVQSKYALISLFFFSFSLPLCWVKFPSCLVGGKCAHCCKIVIHIIMMIEGRSLGFLLDP